MQLKLKRGNRAGFTLVELVVVILVLGILAAIGAPRIMGTASNARNNGTKESLSIIRDAIEYYKADHTDTYPPAATLATALAPYLKGPFPTCQVGNVNSTVVASTQNPIATAETGGAGWAYNQSTGQFVVNHADGIAW